jgi:probable rRNA maturation factor
MAITFQSQRVTYSLPAKQLVKKWIVDVVRNEKKNPGNINFLFTSDEEVLQMNIRYLQHDTYTDIITFDSGEGGTVAGDITISVDRVRDNASRFNTSFADEMHRVIIHGILHLCGYKDKTVAQRSVMRKKEDEALRKLKKMT